MKVSTGTRGTGLDNARQVALTVTGMNNIDYSRTADMVMNVPFTRMRETMHLIHCMGGKIVGVSVTGGASGSAPPAPRKGKHKGNSDG
jgi:phycocyanin-associated rod protein